MKYYWFSYLYTAEVQSRYVLLFLAQFNLVMSMLLTLLLIPFSSQGWVYKSLHPNKGNTYCLGPIFFTAHFCLSAKKISQIRTTKIPTTKLLENRIDEMGSTSHYLKCVECRGVYN